MEKFEGPEKVRIKHAEKAGYFGLSSYPKSTVTLGCQISASGAFATGLTKEEEEYYEKTMKLDKGTLASYSKWWGEVFNEKHPIRLSRNKSNDLYLNDPINQLRYKVLLAHDKVANSEIEIGSRPGILFYIDDPETAAKAKYEVINFKWEATKLIMKMTGDEKRSALRLFGKTGVDHISDDMASTQLFSEMERSPKEFLDTLTDPKLKAKEWVYELVEKGLLKRVGATYKYNDETIAGGIEECIDYFSKNEDVRLSITTRLNKIKK